jgi:hypothetical protein
MTIEATTTNYMAVSCPLSLRLLAPSNFPLRTPICRLLRGHRPVRLLSLDVDRLRQFRQRLIRVALFIERLLQQLRRPVVAEQLCVRPYAAVPSHLIAAEGRMTATRAD